MLKQLALRLGSLALLILLVAVPRAMADMLVTSDPVVFGDPGRILHYTNSGVFVGDFTSGHPLGEPLALTFGPDSNLYVLDSGSGVSNTVSRYNGTTGAYINEFIPAGTGGLGEAKNMIFGPDGNLYIASNAFVGGIGERGEVLRFNGADGAFMDHFIPNGAGAAEGTQRLSEAMSLAFDKAGNLYVGNDGRSLNGLGTDAYNILHFDSTGTYSNTFVPDNANGLADPNGLIFGSDGKLYISSEGQDTTNPNAVLRYTASGTFDGSFVTSGLGGLDEPHGLVFGPDGNLYVVSSDSDAVLRYNGTTGAFIADNGGTGFIPAGGEIIDGKGIVFFSAVPEPTSVLLLGSGLAGLVAWRRKHSA